MSTKLQFVHLAFLALLLRRSAHDSDVNLLGILCNRERALL